MCVIGAGVSFVLRDQQDAAFLIELKRNPNAGDRRVRATLKPFKKSHHHSEEIEIHTKIKLANEENFRLRQRLKEHSRWQKKINPIEAILNRIKSKNFYQNHRFLERVQLEYNHQ
ncbi:hypothetical protein QR98_0091510 [Sarcoptes scabiei]|uniref:Uncharacterized protein n=1 Tax=Sarcoptes scabiei TaxID=52283 RepID=A0A132AHW7_SARSC|nr:hypothetical protein QR98_0091510 [Sarcoptes scabiei]